MGRVSENSLGHRGCCEGQRDSFSPLLKSGIAILWDVEEGSSYYFKDGRSTCTCSPPYYWSVMLIWCQELHMVIIGVDMEYHTHWKTSTTKVVLVHVGTT